MGQAPSSVVSYDQDTSTPTDSSAQPSLDSLIAEAAAYGDDDENQSLEGKAEKALECPCIAELRNGPCGTQFSDAFICFLKSTDEEKGSDCFNPFVALQKCIKANPNAFSKDILEDEEIKNGRNQAPSIQFGLPFGPKNQGLQSAQHSSDERRKFGTFEEIGVFEHGLDRPNSSLFLLANGAFEVREFRTSELGSDRPNIAVQVHGRHADSEHPKDDRTIRTRDVRRVRREISPSNSRL